jgi:hypothetical protein
MLRKLLSLGAVIVVAVAFGAGTASAKKAPATDTGSVDAVVLGTDGFSDGRLLGNGADGFSDGRLLR